MNRRNFLSSAFAASVLPQDVFASSNILQDFHVFETGKAFRTQKPSLVLLFMTAQRMYPSCGDLFYHASAEVNEIKGGARNVEKIMIMPPLESQQFPEERRNIQPAKDLGFTILTSDIQSVLSASRRLAGRGVFAFDGQKITGHSQKAFFHDVKRGRSFEYDPAASPYNELFQGLQRL